MSTVIDFPTAAEQPVVSIVAAAPGPKSVEVTPVEEPARADPLYDDLPRELRNWRPKLEMSMRFYTEAASRRLVRINGRL